MDGGKECNMKQAHKQAQLLLQPGILFFLAFLMAVSQKQFWILPKICRQSCIAFWNYLILITSRRISKQKGFLLFKTIKARFKTESVKDWYGWYTYIRKRWQIVGTTHWRTQIYHRRTVCLPITSCSTSDCGAGWSRSYAACCWNGSWTLSITDLPLKR